MQCVQITGGEPLSRGKKFIFSLINLLKNFHVKEIEIFTNLSFVDDEYIRFFKKNNIKIATSFYSKDEKIHDEITGTQGSQQNSLEKIQQLISNDISVRIGIVILNKNIVEATSLRSWLNNKLNLSDPKQYDVIRPMGRGNNLQHIPMQLFEKTFVIRNYLPYYDFDKYFYNKHFNSCWGNKICLKSDGFLYPCVMSKFKLGHYKKINNILMKHSSYRFLTKDKVKKCKVCKYKYLCDECRAMNEFITKDYKSKKIL